MVNKKKSETRIGRPEVTELERKDPNTGLTGYQLKWLQEHSDKHDVAVAAITRNCITQVERLLPVADAQDIPVYQIFERVVDWYIDGLKLAQANLMAMQAEHDREKERK